MIVRTLFLIFQAVTAIAPDAAGHLEASLFGSDGGHYFHIAPDGAVTLWQETNGRLGLQTVAKDGTPADTRILL